MLRVRMRRSTQILMVLPAVMAALWMPLSGRAADSPLEAAALAWDRGDYVTALNMYLQILDSPGVDDATLETIALQTGELFKTVELTTDGGAPRFSPDSTHASFETGQLPARVTRVIRTEDPGRSIAELKGHALTFSPDGKQLAYLKPEWTSALSQLQAALDAAPPAQRQARTAAFNQQLALDSKIVIRDLTSGRETELAAPDMRKTGLAFTSAGVLFSGSTSEQGAVPQIYTVADGAAPRAITTGEGDKQFLDVSASGAVATYSVRTAGGGRGDAGAPRPFGILRADTGATTTVTATSLALSSDGSTVAYVTREGAEYPTRDRAGRRPDVSDRGAQGTGAYRCARAVARWRPRRFPDDAEGGLGDLPRQSRWQRRNANDAGDPARHPSPLPRRHARARDDRRGTPPPILHS